MTSSSTRYPVAEGAGSVSQAPQLPAGFTDRFTSRYVDAGGLRQHAVIGGDGPPLLLVHGWPEDWYAWRESPRGPGDLGESYPVDPVRVVRGQRVADDVPGVVADRREPLVAERIHQRDG